ncbi:uncharacterized protein LOC113339353 isoform X3 [Papaver somniferum]|uniref:uncharacterized protein LOC113339353 isoform X3 n=1 Tax=Papaver somniferum TaxID=3469 RepID=UPI000E702B1D|nr:uncharacterized protein LOC113339353 isoform X3 [Papaver somniferum]
MFGMSMSICITDRGRGIHSNRGPLQTLTCTNIKSLRFEEGDEIQVMQEMVADAKSGITNGTVFEDEIDNQIQICSDDL